MVGRKFHSPPTLTTYIPNININIIFSLSRPLFETVHHQSAAANCLTYRRLITSFLINFLQLMLLTNKQVCTVTGNCCPVCPIKATCSQVYPFTDTCFRSTLLLVYVTGISCYENMFPSLSCRGTRSPNLICPVTFTCSLCVPFMNTLSGIHHYTYIFAVCMPVASDTTISALL
jgi:hypothetical protein